MGLSIKTLNRSWWPQSSCKLEKPEKDD